MAMPWTRAKKMAEEYRNGTRDVKKLTALFDACFRIQREASEAAGRYIPMVVENVKGAQPWVGRAKWHYGSYYLWGDVPALMPFACGTKIPPHINESIRQGRSPARWTNSAEHYFGRKCICPKVCDCQNPDGDEVAHVSKRGQDFTRIARNHAIKNNGGGSRFAVAHNTESGHSRNPVNDGVKQHGSGRTWFDQGICKQSSRSDSRKAASALIAKIPFPLANHIALAFKEWRDLEP